jgi:hypothetical protein
LCTWRSTGARSRSMARDAVVVYRAHRGSVEHVEFTRRQDRVAEEVGDSQALMRSDLDRRAVVTGTYDGTPLMRVENPRTAIAEPISLHPTASRRVRPLVSLAPRSEPNLTFLTRWRARLGAPYHSIQRPARVCRLRDVPLRTQNVRRGSAQNVPRWSRTAHRAGVMSGRGARARDPGRAVRPASA